MADSDELFRRVATNVSGNASNHAMAEAATEDGWTSWTSLCGAHTARTPWDSQLEIAVPTCPQCIRCYPHELRTLMETT